MDPVLIEIYRTVIDAAPYVLAAYGLLWIGLMAYIAYGLRRVAGLEKQIAVLEESMARRGVSTES